MSERPVTIRLAGGVEIVQDMDDEMLESVLDTIFNKTILGIYHAPTKRQIWIQCSNVSCVEYAADSMGKLREPARD